MGTRMAPNYANIFMNRLEKTFLSDRPLRPLFYRRYIDDIFLIWEHTEDQLLEFIRDFNSAHPDIKFTHTYSQAEVNFLDVTVLVVGKSLKTKLYRKPTDSLKYLHYNSCHPRHCKTSIPYGQAHRFRRICSDEGDFNTNAAHLRSALIEQNYTPPVVDSAIERARALDRDKLLTGTPPDRRENRKNNLVLTYSNNMPNINNILKRHFNIIQQSERLRNIIPSPPRAVFRRHRNLKDMIVRARTTPVENIGSRPCLSPRCEVCLHVSPTLTARSTGSNFTFRIRGDLHCSTANVVYLLECGECHMQYVGQTKSPFRIRFNNHRSDTEKKPTLPLSKHMKLKDHSFEMLTVTILESGFGSHREREQKESFLIREFNTLRRGINEDPGILTPLQVIDV
ncbi:unnamed protein product [Ixodes persulcatus]